VCCRNATRCGQACRGACWDRAAWWEMANGRTTRRQIPADWRSLPEDRCGLPRRCNDVSRRSRQIDRAVVPDRMVGREIEVSGENCGWPRATDALAASASQPPSPAQNPTLAQCLLRRAGEKRVREADARLVQSHLGNYRPEGRTWENRPSGFGGRTQYDPFSLPSPRIGPSGTRRSIGRSEAPPNPALRVGWDRIFHDFSGEKSHCALR